MRQRRPGRASQYETDAYREIVARLAKNARRLRDRKGWTQEEAAHHCGMATRVWQRVESGEVNATVTTLARLCEGLGVDVGRLFEMKR